MKKRYLYSLLVGIPGFFVSALLSLLVFGASVGFLWIYVLGDDPWPVSTGTIFSIGLALTFLLLWIGFIVIGYLLGKKLENDPALNKTHIFMSAGFTLVFVLFILFQQWSVGNIGPKSDPVICSEYCIQKGFAGSGVPPRDSGDRTCSCYDSSGNEALKIPLDRIDQRPPRR